MRRIILPCVFNELSRICIHTFQISAMKEDSPNQPNNNDTYPFYARMGFEDSGTMALQNLPSDNDKWVAFLKAHVERLKMGLGMFRIC